MMKSFFLDFNLNKEDGRVIKLIEELEEFEACFQVDTEEGKIIPIIKEPIINLYVDCTGGENRMASMLYDFLSSRPFNYQYTIVGELSSNAILLLLALNPKYLKINRQAISTIHLSSYNHPVKELVFSSENSVHLNDFADFKDYSQTLVNVYSNFMTKEELTTIKRGGDVVINSKRLVSIFRKLWRDKEFQKKCKNIFELTL